MHLSALSRAFLLGKNTNKSINFVDFISDYGIIEYVRSNKTFRKCVENDRYK